jgi:hypothetical protein
MNDKRKKFVSLAEARVKKTLNDIRLIGNLSNKNAYSYTDEDIKKIFRALQRELDSSKAKFGGEGSGKDTEFRLEG